MSFFKKKTGTGTDGSLWRNAEHPGHGSKKEEERGGTRRAVAKEKVTEAVQQRVTRNPTSRNLEGAGQRIRQEQKELKEAQALARQLGVRQPRRTVSERTLRRMRKQAKAAKKAARKKKLCLVRHRTAVRTARSRRSGPLVAGS